MRFSTLLALPLLVACGSPQDATSQAATATISSATRTASERPTVGLDRERMAVTVANAARLPRIRSLLVLCDGKFAAEHRFNGGPRLDRPVNIKSASKTVMSALVGIAIQRGVLSGTGQTVTSVLASDAPSGADPMLSRVTVGNLLSMQAGLKRTSGENYGAWVSSPNWVRYVLSRPLVDRPGGGMLYSTGSTHLLSAMLTRASGRSTYALTQDWLAGPLGVSIPPWTRDPQGVFLGGNEMSMSPRGLARFGELYRLGGVLDGRRILPARWIEESWTPRTVSPWSGERYGYGWFLTNVGGHPVRFAWGYGGQMLYVVPDLRLTVVMTSDATAARDGGHIAALHALLAEGVIPAAERGET